MRFLSYILSLSISAKIKRKQFKKLPILCSMFFFYIQYKEKSWAESEFISE